MSNVIRAIPRGEVHGNTASIVKCCIRLTLKTMQNTHENLAREEVIERSSNRSFGWVFTAVFLIVALLPLWSGAPVRWWAFAVAAIFATLALVAPQLLERPNRLWQRFGQLLHHVVSPIALALVFYGAVMPTGLVMRLLGHDPLRLRRKPAAKSYWIERKPPGPPADSLKNQF